MMHGIDQVDAALPAATTAVGAAVPAQGATGPVARLLDQVNHLVVILSSIALLMASLVLTYSVVVRYFLKISTDWQDETSVFLIIGAVFMSAAAVQARRGHVGIEAITVLLSRRANRVRLFLVDLISLMFCTYFAWKSWVLLHEAWVDNHHSGSTWAPPLWIPYSLMTVGMVLLSVQILLQLATALERRRLVP